VDVELEKPLKGPAQRDGVLAVFKGRSSAEQARKALQADPRAASDARVLDDTSELGPLALTPTEPQTPRNRRIRYGVALGAALGAGGGLALNWAIESWQWMPLVTAFLGVVLGVLWGSTIGGLGFRSYRDEHDREAESRPRARPHLVADSGRRGGAPAGPSNCQEGAALGDFVLRLSLGRLVGKLRDDTLTPSRPNCPPPCLFNGSSRQQEPMADLPVTWVRSLLRHVRVHSGRTARFASRFNRATRYGWDMVLWSHLLGRKRDPIPTDLPKVLLEEKGVCRQPPALHLSGPADTATAWEQGFAAVNAALLLNLQVPDVLSRIRYAHPAPAFRGVYLWDSAFTAQVWKGWDIGVANDVLDAVVELRDGARLQHVVADFVESKYTQPPLIAWSAAACYSASQSVDTKRLYRLYRELCEYHEWLWRERQVSEGLFAWDHPYESGIDNSPRFSSRDESEFSDTRQMASPDFAAYIVLQLEALQSMAERLGHDEDVKRHRSRTAIVRDAANEHLWSEEHGLYFDLNVNSGQYVLSTTIASLLPLWAGIPDANRAGRLLEWIMNPAAFNTLIPLPTVARNAPEFSKDMWRGPVWINTAYGVIQGLQRYGYLEEAATLAFRLCDGVYRTFDNCRRVFEFYDPDRFDIDELARKQGNRWKRATLGKKPVTEFVGWSGLVNTLVIEVLVGFHRDDGATRLRPLLPPQTEGMAFSVRLPQEGLAITVERDNGASICGVVRSASGVQRFQAPFGEVVTIKEADDSPGCAGESLNGQQSPLIPGVHC